MTLKAFTFSGAEQPAERGLLSLARLSPCAFFRKSKAAGFVLAIQAALGAAAETEGFWLAANSPFKVLLQKGNALPLTDGSPVLGGGSQQGPPALTCVLGVADKFPAVERQLLSGFLSFPQSCSFTCSFAPSEICPLLCTTTSSVRSGQASD